MIKTPTITRQRGAAALIVVMLLFFLLSLVAAYASRSLIFEQKTSANQYRATQAFESADAGIEWALAMLNGARIDAACVPSTVLADTNFRARYLDIDAGGTYTPRTWLNAGTAENLTPSCVRDSSGWNCSCPANGAPVLTDPGGNGSFPAFRVRFDVATPPSAPSRPGVVRITSTGCTRLNQDCLSQAQGTSGEAAARIVVDAALASALPTPPGAALTVHGAFSPSGAITLRNLDLGSNGVTVNSGGAATPGAVVLETLPGTPAQFSVVDNDVKLSSASADQLFVALFRSDKLRYKYQPAAVRLDNCASSCSAKLFNAWQFNPGRVLWVDGDMTIDTAQTFGTVDEPVLIVATGNVQLTNGVVIYGLLYSQGADWTNSGNATVHGAVVTEGDFHDASASVIEYRPDILKTLKVTTGSLVRVPGSWRDF